MCLIVRKIEKAKWLQNDILNGADYSADAITGCMKTRQNALSVWQVESESCVGDAVLAMASSFDHLESVDFVWISQEKVADAGLSLVESPGRTPVSGLESSHRNISQLTYHSLGVLAALIRDALAEERYRRYTKNDLIKMLSEAVQQGRLEKTDLGEHVQKRLD